MHMELTSCYGVGTLPLPAPSHIHAPVLLIVPTVPLSSSDWGGLWYCPGVAQISACKVACSFSAHGRMGQSAQLAFVFILTYAHNFLDTPSLKMWSDYALKPMRGRVQQIQWTALDEGTRSW